MPFIGDFCEDFSPSMLLSVFTAVVTLVLSLITVPGNLLVCISIIKDPYRELKTSFNYFVLQLAVSDLVVGALTEPFFVVFHVREALGYPVIANIWIIHLSFFVTYTASLLSLMALTLDRYLTVISCYKRILSKNTITFLSVLIWLVSLLVSCLYFATGFYLFAFIFTNTALVVMISLLTFSYVRIQQKLKAQISRWHWFQQIQVKLDAIATEKKLTNAFFVILGIFMLCLCPSLVMIYVINFCDTCHCALVHWLRDLHFLFPLVNCALNQFLYAWRIRTFRRAISGLLSKSVSYDVARPMQHSPAMINSKSPDELELLPLDLTHLVAISEG